MTARSAWAALSWGVGPSQLGGLHGHRSAAGFRPGPAYRAPRPRAGGPPRWPARARPSRPPSAGLPSRSELSRRAGPPPAPRRRPPARPWRRRDRVARRSRSSPGACIRSRSRRALRWRLSAAVTSARLAAAAARLASSRARASSTADSLDRHADPGALQRRPDLVDLGAGRLAGQRELGPGRPHVGLGHRHRCPRLVALGLEVAGVDAEAGPRSRFTAWLSRTSMSTMWPETLALTGEMVPSTYGVVGADLGARAIPGPAGPAEDADGDEGGEADDGAATHPGSTTAAEQHSFMVTTRLPSCGPAGRSGRARSALSGGAACQGDRPVASSSRVAISVVSAMPSGVVATRLASVSRGPDLNTARPARVSIGAAVMSSELRRTGGARRRRSSP